LPCQVLSPPLSGSLEFPNRCSRRMSRSRLFVPHTPLDNLFQFSPADHSPNLFCPGPRMGLDPSLLASRSQRGLLEGIAYPNASPLAFRDLSFLRNFDVPRFLRLTDKFLFHAFSQPRHVLSRPTGLSTLTASPLVDFFHSHVKGSFSLRFSTIPFYPFATLTEDRLQVVDWLPSPSLFLDTSSRIVLFFYTASS